ncbi:amidase [Thalassobaculum fulvum]|uniref:Amidase n=1 Tax=Thalassobaculum fulvum TaxID=1633335 RepID=A0A918XPS1_9PROT|nr:amidase [Thalassobaculum fulvum]GHD43041.1 amidase [Thalassobaculum fulvum]
MTEGAALGKPGYDPATYRPLTWSDHAEAFRSGADRPSDYLARCLAVIAAREPKVRAWVTLNEVAAMPAAEAADKRWREGKPLSPVDGMPVGVKDLYMTRDLPTQMGSPLYAGRTTGEDSACVQALRLAGALVLGKTVTTELGFSHPGPTTNPFDPARTPGGSSSGSAAAVGAGMVPAAIGSQVVGSVIRPAGFCANTAIKPTLGALHRGERQGLSHSHLGVHAGGIEDMWAVAYALARFSGGDPGFPGLYGPEAAPPAAAPRSLIVVESEGWAQTDDATLGAFERLLEAVAAAGVTLVRRTDRADVEALEREIAESLLLCRDICGWELRWTLRNLAYKDVTKLSDSMRTRLELAEAMSIDDYRAALAKREAMRSRFRAVAGTADAMITLSSAGPAPLMAGNSGAGEPGITHMTGLPAYNAWTSAIGCPAVTVPMLAVGGMPVGVQIVGRHDEDWRIAGYARWLKESVAAVAG